MIKFCIAGVRRSGTTLIRTTLDSHPRVRCVGEVFRYSARFRLIAREKNELSYWQFINATPWRRFQDMLLRENAVNGYLDHLYSAKDCDAIGFKLMNKHSEHYPAVLKYLRRHDGRVIHLVRKNVLKTMISRAVKQITHRGQATAAEAAPVIRVTLQEERLLSDLERIHRTNEWWQEQCVGMHYLRVTYEDFVADKQSELRRMLDYLEVENVPDLKSHLIKVNPDNIRDVVTNYDAVRHRLEGTPFAWCLTP